MEFKEWFCLDKRDSFTIDPKINPEDARFYFSRDEIKKQIRAQLRRSFIDPKAPKMLFFGAYGSGKTQLLYHLDYYLNHEPPDTCKFKPHIVHLNIEMKARSDHRHWHLQLMEALGKGVVTKWVENIAKTVGSVEEELAKIFKDPNVAEAVRKLLIGGLDHTAWRWLCGQEMPARDLEQLKVTRSLGYIGAGDMARTIISMGRLAELNGEKLIFMMDEAERFMNVRGGDETEYLHDYLRELSEKYNDSTGFMIAGTAIAESELAALLRTDAILRRIGRNNYIDIPYLSAVGDVQNFLQELLKELIDQRQAEERIRKGSLDVSLVTYPFNAESFDLLCQYATEDPSKALPSHIIHAVNECAISAWDQGKPIIEPDIVNEIAPLVFG